MTTPTPAQPARPLSCPAPDAAPAPRCFLRHGMLPQLAAFEAVVRLGSVTRAAEALCMAQPTLSGHLRKLGDALGVRLFEQQGRRLVPTEQARVLLAATREVFAALARCEQTLVRGEPPQVCGEAALSAPACAAAAQDPRMLVAGRTDLLSDPLAAAWAAAHAGPRPARPAAAPAP